MERASEAIKRNYVESWHKPQQDMNFKLSDLDGQNDPHGYGNNYDRDGKILFNGQTKSYIVYKGEIGKGKIYHNINNMWWIITSEYNYTNIACFRLFDDNFKRKLNRLIPKITITKKRELL